MLTKLRNQFVLLSTTMILIVIVVSFACIYFITDFYIYTQNETRLININLDSVAVKLEAVNEKTIDISSYSLVFTLYYDENNKIESFQSYFTIPVEEYEEAGKKALSTNKSVGVIRVAGKRWMFHKIGEDNIPYTVSDISGTIAITQLNEVNQITFMDVTESYDVLNLFLIVFCIVGPLILLAIIGISFVFANRAIIPIKVFIDKQKRFISDASHELKTPIAIISTNAEAVLLNNTNPDEVTRWTNNIVNQSERMNKLVANLLTFARSDEKTIPIQLGTISASAIVEEAITTVEAFFFDKKINLEMDIQPQLNIMGNEENFKQVVLILLDNALKYTDPNGWMKVTLGIKKHSVVLSVENTTTEALGDDQISRIFDRFYRGDDARENKGSFGLGLSIAKSFVEAMGGKITASATSAHSILFQVRLKMRD